MNFVIEETIKAGIPELVDSSLPKRRGGSTYKWSDAILGMIYGAFCGADRLEDLETLKKVMHNKTLNIPSSDQISIILRRNLSTPNIALKAKESGMIHKINVNEPLNGLLVDIAVKLGTLKKDKAYVLDYDNHVICAEKCDALFAYTKERGYQPGVCFIGQTPVWVEGMNGNNPASFDQENTLKRALENLESRGIKVRRFRADNASYQPEIIRMFDTPGCDFFLRATNSRDLYEAMDIFDWKQVRLANDTFEVGEFTYVPFSDKGANTKPYRIVTTRRPTDEPHHITGKNFVYRSIITNNYAMSPVEVVATYNRRGYIEKNFDILNNDWSWQKLPFSYLSENTAFMLVMAMGMVLYNHLVRLFASRVDFVEETFRMKAFQFNVINVAAEWKKDLLVIYDQSRPWEKLVG